MVSLHKLWTTETGQPAKPANRPTCLVWPQLGWPAIAQEGRAARKTSWYAEHMKTNLSADELADVLRQVGASGDDALIANHRHPAKGYIREEADPSQPHVVELHWQLANLGIAEWFLRVLKLVVACMLVSVALAIPALILWAAAVGSVFQHASSK